MPGTAAAVAKRLPMLPTGGRKHRSQDALRLAQASVRCLGYRGLRRVGSDVSGGRHQQHREAHQCRSDDLIRSGHDHHWPADHAQSARPRLHGISRNLDVSYEEMWIRLPRRLGESRPRAPSLHKAATATNSCRDRRCRTPHSRSYPVRRTARLAFPHERRRMCASAGAIEPVSREPCTALDRKGFGGAPA